MSRTKTGTGILGDPVNMGILGTAEDIHVAMQQSGWVKADPITLRSALGIAISTIKHTSYPEAPVSDLFLFGKKQDFAYQMEVNGSASRRHHVRFWKVPEGWRLPGGKQVEWLAAATFDKGVGLATSTLQITHKIDRYVDKERDFIIDSLLYADNDITVDVIEEFTIPYADENGGGDNVETDGNMPIVNLIDAGKRAGMNSETTVKKDTSLISVDNEALNKELPPKSLIYIGVFVVLKFILVTLGVLSMFFAKDHVMNAENVTVLVAFFIGGALNLLLYILTLKKYKWSRLVFLIMVSIACTGEILTLSTKGDLGFTSFLYSGLSLAVMLILSSLDVRQWVYTIHKRGE